MSAKEKIDDGGSAFPGFEYTEGRGACRRNAAGEFEHFVGGMSLRDYFAAKALAGCEITTENSMHTGFWYTPSILAARCYAIADAMLVEREKRA